MENEIPWVLILIKCAACAHVDSEYTKLKLHVRNIGFTLSITKYCFRLRIVS